MTTEVHTTSGNVQLPVDTPQEALMALHADHAHLQHKALPKDLLRADMYAVVTVSLEHKTRFEETSANELQGMLEGKLQNWYTCPDKDQARFVLQVYITEIQRNWMGKRHVTVEWFLSSHKDGAPEIFKSGRCSPDLWSRQNMALVKAVTDELVKEIRVRRRQPSDLSRMLDDKKQQQAEPQQEPGVVRKSSSYDYAEHMYEDH